MFLSLSLHERPIVQSPGSSKSFSSTHPQSRTHAPVMGRGKPVSPGRGRGVIRRFVRNVWQKNSFRQLAQDYSSSLPSLAAARKLDVLAFHNVLLHPDVQRVSARLLRRLLCLANWSTPGQDHVRLISGHVSLAIWRAILRYASHPPRQAHASGQAVSKSSLALVQYVEDFVQGLCSGLSVSVAMQSRKKLSFVVAQALRDLKRLDSDNSKDNLAHALQSLEGLQRTRFDRGLFSAEQNHIIDCNIAHLEQCVQGLQPAPHRTFDGPCLVSGLDTPSDPSGSGHTLPSISPEIDEYCQNLRETWGNERIAHEMLLCPLHRTHDLLGSQSPAVPSTTWVRVSRELMGCPPTGGTLFFLLQKLITYITFLQKNTYHYTLFLKSNCLRRAVKKDEVTAIEDHYRGLIRTVQSLLTDVQSIRIPPGQSPEQHRGVDLLAVTKKVSRFFALVHRVHAITEHFAGMAAADKAHNSFRQALRHGLNEPSSFIAVCAQGMWECMLAMVIDVRHDLWTVMTANVHQYGARFFGEHLLRRLSLEEVSLPKTTQCIVRTAGRARTDGTFMKALLAGSKAAYQSLVYGMWVDAVVDFTTAPMLPELCFLDQGRVQSLHRAFHLDLTGIIVLRTALEVRPWPLHPCHAPLATT